VLLREHAGVVVGVLDLRRPHGLLDLGDHVLLRLLLHGVLDPLVDDPDLGRDDKLLGGSDPGDVAVLLRGPLGAVVDVLDLGHLHGLLDLGIHGHLYLLLDGHPTTLSTISPWGTPTNFWAPVTERTQRCSCVGSWERWSAYPLWGTSTGP